MTISSYNYLFNKQRKFHLCKINCECRFAHQYYRYTFGNARWRNTDSTDMICLLRLWRWKYGKHAANQNRCVPTQQACFLNFKGTSDACSTSPDVSLSRSTTENKLTFCCATFHALPKLNYIRGKYIPKQILACNTRNSMNFALCDLFQMKNFDYSEERNILNDRQNVFLYCLYNDTC